MSQLIVVPDSNVLIHGKSLREIPWADFGADQIEVRIVAQVVSEIDVLKNKPGRPSRVARDLSSEFRTLLGETDMMDVLVANNPRVTRRLWLGKNDVKSASREGLDLSHGDQAIINQVVAMADAGCEVLFLTDDVLAAAHAGEFGAPYRLLPADWRRPAEQDESQKEVARLKAENARLQAAEPRFRGWFETISGDEVARLETTVPRYVPLSPSTIEALMSRIQQAAPMARLTPPASRAPSSRGPVDLAALHAEWGGGMSPVTAYQITKYEAAYDTWIATIRNRLQNLHIHRTHRRPWPKVSFVAVNESERPANQTLIEFNVRGDFTIARPERLTGAVGQVDEARRRSEAQIDPPPATPKPERRELPLSALQLAGLARPGPAFNPHLQGIMRSRDDHAFYWRNSQDGPVRQLDLECASWRHRRDPEAFEFVIEGPDASPVSGAVIATVSAANVSEPLTVTLAVRIAFEEQSLEDDAESMVAAFEQSRSAGGGSGRGSATS